MKKLVMILMAFAGTMMLNAQSSKPGSADGKISEFSKFVNAYANGQRVDKVRLATLYKEINCLLTENQAEALEIDLTADTREENCGSPDAPKTQTVSDASFKRYAEQVAKYLEYQKRNGDK